MASKQELENRINNLEQELEEVKQIATRSQLDFPLDKKSKEVIREVFDKYIELGRDGYVDLGTALITSLQKDGENKFIFVAGSGEVENKDLFSDSTVNSQIELIDVPSTTGSTNMSFFRGFRPPIYSNEDISLTSGESTLTDSKWNWDTNELAGAYVSVFDSNSVLFDTFQITSNTSTEITVNGTWSQTESNATYFVFMPIYLGSAGTPWRRGYFGEDIRLGFGSSGGDEVLYIKWGTGSPEGSVTANVGSLFLRKDGGSGTTLYVKESGTGNTGWTAK